MISELSVFVLLGHCMTAEDYLGIVFLLPNPSTAPENNSGPGAVNWKSHTFGLISSRPVDDLR